jgi:hypothetical protein
LRPSHDGKQLDGIFESQQSAIMEIGRRIFDPSQHKGPAAGADSFLDCPLTALAPSFAFKPGKTALLYFAGVVVIVVVVVVVVELGGPLF